MTVGGIIDQKFREEHLVKFSSGIVFTSGSTKATSLRAAAIHFNNNKRNAKIKKNKTISCQCNHTQCNDKRCKCFGNNSKCNSHCHRISRKNCKNCE